MDAKEFLIKKGISPRSIEAVRFPHKYKMEEYELLPLMEEYAAACALPPVSGNEVELCATCKSKLREDFREGSNCLACIEKFG